MYIGRKRAEVGKRVGWSERRGRGERGEVSEEGEGSGWK